jgi:hypothetical protein
MIFFVYYVSELDNLWWLGIIEVSIVIVYENNFLGEMDSTN